MTLTLRDRGNIKWTAMMLPEHVERIKQLAIELNKVPKPLIDEQQYREMEQTISFAFANNKPLSLTYWEDGFYKTIIGKLKNVNRSNKQLHIIDDTDNSFTISFHTLVDVAECDENDFSPNS